MNLGQNSHNGNSIGKERYWKDKYKIFVKCKKGLKDNPRTWLVGDAPQYRVPQQGLYAIVLSITLPCRVTHALCNAKAPCLYQMRIVRFKYKEFLGWCNRLQLRKIG